MGGRFFLKVLKYVLTPLHLKDKHIVNLIINWTSVTMDTEELKKEELLCFTCGKTFDNKAKLRRHSQNDFNVESSCRQCNAKFVNKLRLNKHCLQLWPMWQTIFNQTQPKQTCKNVSWRWNLPKIYNKFQPSLAREHGVSITNEVHIIMDHVEEYILTTAKGLGRMSDQIVEACHSAVNKRLIKAIIR